MNLARGVDRNVPGFLRSAAYRVFNVARGAVYTGSARHCPCCGRSSRKFLPAGTKRREDAVCPSCGARERQRLLWLYLSRETDLSRRPLRVLHFAPEECLSRRFRAQRNLSYVTADLEATKADVAVDITSMQFPPESFDVVLCCHVLEHVPDDRRALSEIFRVLRPAGWAILQVPIDATALTTEEGAHILDPLERERRFGQADHIRMYGRDYLARLRAAGFDVTVTEYAQQFTPHEIRRMSLDPDEPVFFARKPLNAKPGG